MGQIEVIGIGNVPTMECEGCGEQFVNLFDGRPVCMGCVEARAKSATVWGHRCKCPKGKRRETAPIGRAPMRVFTSCDRCLGAVRQIS